VRRQKREIQKFQPPNRAKANFENELWQNQSRRVLDGAGFSGALGWTMISVESLRADVPKAVLKSPQSRRSAPSGCNYEFLVLKTRPGFSRLHLRVSLPLHDRMVLGRFVHRRSDGRQNRPICVKAFLVTDLTDYLLSELGNIGSA